MAALLGVSFLAPIIANVHGAGAVSNPSNNNTSFGSTRHVQYAATQWQNSDFWHVYDRWRDGSGGTFTQSGTPTVSITQSGINPTVSGHGVSISASIQQGAGPGIGASAGGGTCNLGDYYAAGSTVIVYNVGTICVISSLISIYGGDAHVTGKTLYGNTWVTFGA
jgi:hypothetical protein